MQDLDDILNSLVELENRKIEQANQIRNSIKNGNRKIIEKLSETDLNLKIAAVDGGTAYTELHGMDLSVLKALCVIFEYENGKLKTTKYFPSKFPTLIRNLRTSLDEHEVLFHRSLSRIELELETAIKAVESQEIDIMLLDGSLLPLLSNKPQETNEQYLKYKKVVEKYKELFSICEKKKCDLVGVIKDSRGRRFIEELASLIKGIDEDILKKSNDTNFLIYLLDRHERTCFLGYAQNPNSHPILKDFEKWAEKIKICYLKPGKDRPFRIEVLSQKRSYEELANIISKISSINPYYSYPAILIEVDLRAMMDHKEIDRMYNSILMKIVKNQNSILKLKRDIRPFR